MQLKVSAMCDSMSYVCSKMIQKYQGQEQVITSLRYRGMQLHVPALDTWGPSQYIDAVLPAYIYI